jgi:hypothetical protein
VYLAKLPFYVCDKPFDPVFCYGSVAEIWRASVRYLMIFILSSTRSFCSPSRQSVQYDGGLASLFQLIVGFRLSVTGLALASFAHCGDCSGLFGRLRDKQANLANTLPKLNGTTARKLQCSRLGL